MAGLLLHRSARQLRNEVIRFFRVQYSKIDTRNALPRFSTSPQRQGRSLKGGALKSLLQNRGALSELHLSHPTIPFHGIIDLIWLDNGKPVILDFKTGAVREHHRDQVLQYAVLWWRCSGVLPMRAEVRYPGKLVAEPLTRTLLEKVEQELELRVKEGSRKLADPPAKASPGEHCRYCDVRQFCDDFWRDAKLHHSDLKRPWATTDVELEVASDASDFGFIGRNSTGHMIPVVYPQGGLALHGPFIEGAKLRVLSGFLDPEGTSIKLTERSEVYRCRE